MKITPLRKTKGYKQNCETKAVLKKNVNKQKKITLLEAMDKRDP